MQIYQFHAHAEGVNGLSWGPSTQPAKISVAEGQTKQFNLPPKRLATCGNDKQVKVWQLTNTSSEAFQVGSHMGWARDVAWCDSIGLQHDMIASVGEDSICKIYKHIDGRWTQT